MNGLIPAPIDVKVGRCVHAPHADAEKAQLVVLFLE